MRIPVLIVSILLFLAIRALRIFTNPFFLIHQLKFQTHFSPPTETLNTVLQVLNKLCLKLRLNNACFDISLVLFFWAPAGASLCLNKDHCWITFNEQRWDIAPSQSPIELFRFQKASL